MAYEFDVVNHRVFEPKFIPESRHFHPSFINVELIIDLVLITLHHNCIANLYSTTNTYRKREPFRFSLNIMQNERLIRQTLEPTFSRLRINTASADYDSFIRQLRGYGQIMSDWAFNNSNICRVFTLRSKIHASSVGHDYYNCILMRRALAESVLELERRNNGMVAAKESSVKDMLNKVRVEDGEEKNCMVCLEELKAGTDASKMPCSHTFHANCIEKWLKQSHCCPICRFKLPTK